MKNKYGFWKNCLNSLAGLAGLAGLVGLAGLTGCTKLKCDFSYLPASPAAGSVVTFSNLSTGADDYYWTFGDNGTSTTSSPTHIYRKPGNYTVTLQIMRNKVEKRQRTQIITVIDTIPTIACDTDTVYTFTPITFKAQVYNPWKKTVTYTWNLPADAVVLDGKGMDSSAIVCYFTQPTTASQVKATVQLDGEKTHQLTYPTASYHCNGSSVIYSANGQVMEQFHYIIRKQTIFSSPEVTTNTEDMALIQAEQDTLYRYGDSIYTLAKVQGFIGKRIQGFQVDRLAGKIYAYGDGLWVCNMTGSNVRCLENSIPMAIKVDGADNRLYWSTNMGLYTHRLLGTQANQELFSPQIVNFVSTISRISVHSNLH